MKNDFLANFYPDPVFEEIWPGRAACLRLRSNRGCLDVWVVYFPTGKDVGPHELHGVRAGLHDRLRTFPTLRGHLRDRVAAKLSQVKDALTVIGGDFNYVSAGDERVSLGTTTESGRKDFREEAHFQRVIARPHGLHDMYQPEHTHASSSARSRLDRIYANFHVADQLDRHLRCAAREWCPDLSAHRAVTFSRSSPARARREDRPLAVNAIMHEDFQRRVVLAYQDKLHQHPEANPLAKVNLLKDAMKDVGRNLERAASVPQPAVFNEDRLGVVMKLIRGLENGFLSDVSACLERYPKVAEYVSNPYDTTGNLSEKLKKLRDHAVELARDHALDELRKSHEDLAGGNTFAAQRARQRNNRLIFRLAPGRSSTFGAIQDSEGRVRTDAKGMADALRQHWSRVFTAGGVDEDLLKKWVAEDAAHRRQGDSVDPRRHFPKLRKCHIKRAIAARAIPPRAPTAFRFWLGASAKAWLRMSCSRLSR